jgi:hypothetical protein
MLLLGLTQAILPSPQAADLGKSLSKNLVALSLWVKTMCINIVLM